jgi:hypothetical protein
MRWMFTIWWMNSVQTTPSARVGLDVRHLVADQRPALTIRRSGGRLNAA